MLMAIQEGCPVRLRAILMTTMTTVLGLVPMMLGSQEGSEVMRPLATVMVFGLTFSTLVTLFVVPCIYILFENIRTKVMGERKKFRQIEEITEEIIPGH
jgi:HAE1 family hydrophobic/amphiphilic exporter-1